ncbi:MAG: hypothetical protein ACK54A_12040 [Sphingobacteriales bacterium]|jgi:hypothetical protein
MRSGLLVFFLLAITISFGQPAASRLKIIGTVHIGNSHFDEEQLIDAINTYQPDIILWEQAEGYKPFPGLGIAIGLGIANPSIEQKALQKILRKQKDLLILGFDTSFERKDYINNIIATSTEVESQLQLAYQKGKMNLTEARNYRRVTIIDSAFYAFILDTTLERINQKDIVDVSRQRHVDETNILLPLAKKYVDSTTAKAFEEMMRFWEKRNAYMCVKIKEHQRSYPGKKILVLTGLDHKYYLSDCLTNYSGLRIEE